MSGLLQRVGFKSNVDSDKPRATSATGSTTVTDGDLKFVGEQGGNSATVAYQEASGAPVETDSPLGYNVGPITILFLNLSRMVGTGIFSTPSTILRGTGSVGLSLIFWALGYFISLSTLSVYLEYAAYFPSRSGSEVAYLEQAYPRPKWFFPSTFAILNVLLSFRSSNAIVMAQYLFAIGGHTPTEWQSKGLAVACYTLAVVFVLFNTKFSFAVSNAIGGIKLLTLIFVSILGLVVLGGHTRVEDPGANFRNAFEGETTPYGLTSSLYKIIFSYVGFENAFNVVNEVKDPVKSIRNSGFGALTMTAVLYILCNIAFFAAIPKLQIEKGKQIVASYFFTSIFGSGNKAVRGFNILIALSSFGNLIAVLLGSSRMLRECGRQGVLPFSRFWASTKPFGTPAGPYLVIWATTILVIVAVPSGDAFSFIVDLAIYPAAVFAFAMGIGLILLRRKRARFNLPQPTFRVYTIVLYFNILVMVYTLVMPWYPPGKGRGDVSFWYATYVVVSIALLITAGVYYVMWVNLIPKWKGYEIRPELLVLEGGAQAHALVKVPVEKLAEWDREHDEAGARVKTDSDDNSAEKFYDAPDPKALGA
ncbi:unnamed protein product [Zymoseptoria tritici ST99CH_3D1]|nr:unnamed protein product [Zymoseptoria tritici ST99CH_3D1]